MDAEVKLRIEDILQDYKEQGYSKLSHNIDQQVFHRANNAFISFRKIVSSQTMELLRFQMREKYGEVGFFQRSSKDDDTKFFMHYNPFLEGRFKEALSVLSEVEKNAVENLFAQMRIVYRTAEAIAREMIEEADLLNESIKGKYITPSNRMTCFYRVLEYPYENNDITDTKTKDLAEEHTDFSSFTLAFFESSPGLQMARGLDRDSYRPVEHQKGKLLSFPGRTISEIDETIEPSLHKVIKIPKFINKGSRFAHVFFVNPFGNYNQEMVDNLPYIKR